MSMPCMHWSHACHTLPEFWVAVGEALATMVRTLHRVGEEGRKRFPTILKRKQSFVRAEREQRREEEEREREEGDRY